MDTQVDTPTNLAPPKEGLLTVEQLQRALPKGLKNNADQTLVDKFNNIVVDDTLRDMYRDNLLSFTSVLSDGRFQLGHYVDAIKYMTHKLMGDSNIGAYRKTFPDRYNDFLMRGVSDKDIASYITSYNKNKLVNIIREQALIPTYILNADYLQKAINKQVELMMDPDVSHTVQQKAADSLMVNLKAPETAKVELNVISKADNVTQELHQTLVLLAAKQKEMIEQGIYRPKEIAESPIQVIEAEQ